MKNNKLHIQYNGTGVKGQSPTGIKQDDYIESFRCTKLERATEIVKRVNKEVIKKAIFKDAKGLVHNII